MVFICNVILHWQCVSLTFMVPFLVSSGLVSDWSEFSISKGRMYSPRHVKCSSCWRLLRNCVTGFVFENNLIGRNWFLLWQGNVYVVGRAPWNTKVWTGEPPSIFIWITSPPLCICVQWMIKQELKPIFKVTSFISKKESCLLASFIFFVGNRIWLKLSKHFRLWKYCFQTRIKSG